MQEKLLHFIWQYQYFSPGTLNQPSERILVLNPGTYNEHAGPDFLFARLEIGGIEWRGHIEIHVRSSDWNLHNHHHDPAYDAVILHVVWENDLQVCRSGGSEIKTVALRDHVSRSVLQKYHDLAGSIWHIPCSDRLPAIGKKYVDKAISNSFKKRLERKMKEVNEMLHSNHGDWEKVAQRMLIRYFGTGRNSAAFIRLGELLPVTVLKRHGDQSLQVEAILFGVAGFLNCKPKDEYHKSLKDEYSFLRKKYSLQSMEIHEWKFLRMRPHNFPSRRIALLASVLCRSQSIFSAIVECHGYRDVEKMLGGSLSEYWKHHYIIGRKCKGSPAAVGKTLLTILAINVIGPIKAAYEAYHDTIDRANSITTFYANLPAENNRYIRLWNSSGIKAYSALDSQGLLGLFHEGCQERQCLDCPVGRELLKLT